MIKCKKKELIMEQKAYKYEYTKYWIDNTITYNVCYAIKKEKFLSLPLFFLLFLSLHILLIISSYSVLGANHIFKKNFQRDIIFNVTAIKGLTEKD